jgi:hypothetical protein
MIQRIKKGDVFESEIWRITVNKVDKHMNKVYYEYRRKNETLGTESTANGIDTFIEDINKGYKLVGPCYDEEML